MPDARGAISVFLPCRKGSERVRDKNVRPFAGRDRGLLEIKLGQLLAVERIREVVLSSNDPEVLAYGASLKSGRVRLHERDDRLGSSQTSTDDLVAHALSLIPEGAILWTHVTSPFFNAERYAAAIAAYEAGLGEGHDSLMSVSVHHGFLWDAAGPTNYDRSVEKWPRTQTIPPVYEINSAVFLNSTANYAALGDRIGARPVLFPTDKVAGFDIDWPDDFRIAEAMAQAGVGVP